jgi:hypothetical protein
MSIQSLLIATLVLSAGLASAQRGGGRPAGGAAPRGPAQPRVAEPGRAAKAPKGAEAPRAPHSNAAVTHLQKNPALAERVAPMLPPGMTAEQAAAGYKNWGQFVAAVNVSKNLNIPFVDLKARTTGTDAMSLGKAVHELRPDLSEEQVRTGVRTAEREAKQIEREAKKGRPAKS